MEITKEIVQKYFYKLYNPNEYEILSWENLPLLNRVDVHWYDEAGWSDVETIFYNDIKKGEREDKLIKLGL